MGLFSDVASGVSGMISVQPDVVGLVRDVAHGMSDTTSKVPKFQVQILYLFYLLLIIIIIIN